MLQLATFCFLRNTPMDRHLGSAVRRKWNPPGDRAGDGRDGGLDETVGVHVERSVVVEMDWSGKCGG